MEGGSSNGVVTFWFEVVEDRRSGVEIYAHNDPSDNSTEFASPGHFNIPCEGKRIYIANNYSLDVPLWQKDISNDEDFNLLYKKIFSQVNKCLPFEISGYDCAYNVEGEYPKISDEIKKMPNVINKKTCKIIKENDGGGYYFVIVIDSNGNNLLTNLLCVWY